MTPEQCAAAVKPAVSTLGSAWRTCPVTLRRARELGLTGWVFHVVGRAGVLGDDAPPDTVAAALGMVAPDAVRIGWEAVAAIGPTEVAGQSLIQCCRWGEENLNDLPGLDRLVSLCEQVVYSADAAGMSLFAAWRAVPNPGDGPGGRASALVHLLREHRSGAHLIAIRACGLSPLEAVIAGPRGAERAMALGWPPPYPPALPMARRYQYAEALTRRIVAPAYAVLDPAERAELAGLIAQAAKLAQADERSVPVR